MLARWPNMELQAILWQIFIMINEGVTFTTLNFTNSWKYFDLSIITSHVSPRLHLPLCQHSPEEVASGPRILCRVMFFHYLSLASLNGLVL